MLADIERKINETTSTTRCIYGIPYYHCRLLLLLALAWSMPCIDTFLFIYLLPAIQKDIQFSVFQEGLVASAVFIGALVGSFSFSYFANIYGRKPLLVLALGCNVISFGITAYANSFGVLMMARLLAGFGNGGSTPLCAFIMQELSPQRVRETCASILQVFWCFGSALAALISRYLGDAVGWKNTFLFACSSVLYMVIVYFYVPETPKWLALTGQNKEANRIVDDMSKFFALNTSEDLEISCGKENITVTTNPVLILTPRQGNDDRLSKGLTIKSLFAGGYCGRTCVIWTTWFLMTFSYYAIYSFLPRFMGTKGFHSNASLDNTFLIILCELPGYVASAYCVERLGNKHTLLLFIFCAFLSGIALGYCPASQLVLIGVGGLFSFFHIGAWGTIVVYTAENYPTWIRGLGSVASDGVSRLAAFLAVFLFPYMLEKWHFSPNLLMWIFGGLHFIVVIVIYLWGIETTNRNIEEEPIVS